MLQAEEYYLMHKNDKVAKFSMTEYGTEINVIEIYDENKMPYGTRVSKKKLNEKFEEWKNGRRVPTERPYLMQVYKKTRKSIAELETYNMGLSMCDCFWYQPIDEDNKWEDVNFFVNKNQSYQQVGKILMNVNNDTPSCIKTPDVTLTGECPKMWATINGALYLVKGCRLYADTKLEVCNEVFASLLAEKLGINTTQYYMMRSGDKFDFCCAEAFIKNDAIEFVSFQQIASDTDTYDITGVLKFMKEHDMQNYINHLIVIDFIIGNYNRTLADIGIFIDSDTMEFISPAPIFDYEESLDINIYDDDIKGVFDDDIMEQLKMVTDFSWIDFSVIDETIDEMDRIYSLGGFKNPEIKALKEYVRNRVNTLKKQIPPEQIKTKKKIEVVAKMKEEKKEEDKIRIHIYDEPQKITNDTENDFDDDDDI